MEFLSFSDCFDIATLGVFFGFGFCMVCSMFKAIAGFVRSIVLNGF